MSEYLQPVPFLWASTVLLAQVTVGEDGVYVAVGLFVAAVIGTAGLFFKAGRDRERVEAELRTLKDEQIRCREKLDRLCKQNEI